MVLYCKVLSGNSKKLSKWIWCAGFVTRSSGTLSLVSSWIIADLSAFTKSSTPELSITASSPPSRLPLPQAPPTACLCSHAHSSLHTHRLHVISADSITESVWMNHFSGVTVRHAASSWRGSCRACWVIAERPGRAADWRSCRASGRPHTDRTELSADSCGDTPSSPAHTHTRLMCLVQIAVDSPLLTLWFIPGLTVNDSSLKKLISRSYWSTAFIYTHFHQPISSS